MITMLDIAKRSGISRYTVSKVLNGNPSVRPATREKVLAACRKYGYIPDSAAVGLVKGHTNLIGVTVPYLTDDFYSEFIEKQMNHYENITIQCHSILHTLDYVTTHRKIFETLKIAMI